MIDQVSRFEQLATGNFTSADGALHFDCLENLRASVARAVTDSPEPLVWTVAGVLTEFRGTNYLLLTQAVLKPPSGGCGSHTLTARVEGAGQMTGMWCISGLPMPRPDGLIDRDLISDHRPPASEASSPNSPPMMWREASSTGGSQ